MWLPAMRTMERSWPDYLTIRRSDGRASFAAAVQLKSYTTAGRPSAATLGAGASVYDTTLGKPVFFGRIYMA